MVEYRLSGMLRKTKTRSLATAALLSSLSISIAWAEETTVPKQKSAYPQLTDQPPAGKMPRMTPDEQEKLKKDLIDARGRQSRVKAKESPTRGKPKEP